MFWRSRNVASMSILRSSKAAGAGWTDGATMVVSTDADGAIAAIVERV